MSQNACDRLLPIGISGPRAMSANILPGDTERLSFKAMRPSDSDLVFDMFNDPLARRFYPDKAEMRSCQGWIDWTLRTYDNHGFGLWWIFEKSTGAFVGDCGLTLQNVQGEKQLEVGYHLIAGQRGQGFAVEAARAALAHGFRTTDYPFICSIVAPENIGSIRVASRIHARSRGYVNPAGRLLTLFWTDR